MELEKIVKLVEEIRDKPLMESMKNEVYHFVNRQEKIYKQLRPQVLNCQASDRVLTCEGILYLIGMGRIEILAPTYQTHLITPQNKNIELLRAPPTGLNFIDPTLKAIHKTVQLKEIPINYKTLFVDVFSDNELREIWKLGKGELNYETILSPKNSTSNRQYVPGIQRGKDLTASSRRKALSE